MKKPAEIRLRDIFLPPNLMSLSRILLTVPIGYFLWLGSDKATLICIVLLVVAAITDALDGFLARRLNQITPLGLLLDPLADKILIITVMIELIFVRGFPLWLAAAIIVRDIFILLCGAKILRRKKSVPASSLAGKYYFGAVAILAGSYIIRFDFGQQLFLFVTIVLFALSSFNYIRTFRLALHDESIPAFSDKPIYKYCRFIMTFIISIIYLYKLYLDILIDFVKLR